MPIVDVAPVADVRTWWLLDRVSLLLEIVALDQDCERLVQQHGQHAEVADIRRRLRVHRANVVAQLHELIDAFTTIH